MAATTNRPGNMENVYENRTTLDYGKIISYEDKCKTLTIQLSDGRTKSMTWSTFKGAWRKKAHTELVIEDQLKDEGFSTEETEEVIASVECGRTIDSAMQNVLEKREEEIPLPVKEATPKKKRGAQLEFDGRSQNICAWAKEFGMSANTLYNWIYYKHMSVEEAFEKAISKMEVTNND